MELQDLYNLIFRATMGAAHAAADQIVERRRMAEEMDILEDTGSKVCCESISPDGNIFRVRFRSFMGDNEANGALCTGFIRTAWSFESLVADLRRFRY